MLARVLKSAQSVGFKKTQLSKETGRKVTLKNTRTTKSFLRAYSEHHGLSQEEVTSRVVEVIKSFNKVDPNAVTAHSHFQKDLGLDSLEQVELILNIEDEFAVDIPDAESEKLQSAEDAINYIIAHPHAK
jgi:NADH dehydrogenase (ubiquinone) 1 alpha/beta subcomplex 1